MKRQHISMILFIVLFFEACHSKAPTNNPVKNTKTESVSSTASDTNSSKKTAGSNIDTTKIISAFNAQMKGYAKKQEENMVHEQAQNMEDAIHDNALFSLVRNSQPIIYGDINHDNLPDAIVPFTIEGRGDGNGWDAHFAIFIGNGNDFVLKEIFDCGNNFSDYIINAAQIQNDTLNGYQSLGLNNDKDEEDSILVKYIFQKNHLIETQH